VINFEKQIEYQVALIFTLSDNQQIKLIAPDLICLKRKMIGLLNDVRLTLFQVKNQTHELVMKQNQGYFFLQDNEYIEYEIDIREDVNLVLLSELERLLTHEVHQLSARIDGVSQICKLEVTINENPVFALIAWTMKQLADQIEQELKFLYLISMRTITDNSCETKLIHRRSTFTGKSFCFPITWQMGDSSNDGYYFVELIDQKMIDDLIEFLENKKNQLCENRSQSHCI